MYSGIKPEWCVAPGSRVSKPDDIQRVAPHGDDKVWKKVDKTLRFHGRRLMRTARGRWWDLRRLGAFQPIFVVGCSRAGTTLVYKTFSVSSQLGSLQRETHDFWMDLHPLPLRAWSSHSLSGADARDSDRDMAMRLFYSETGQQRFVDKNNQNGLCVPYLRELWPDAFFIYVKRAPGDNLNSLMEGWRRPAEFATWSDGLPGRPAIDQGRIRRWCFFLPPGWQDYLAASLEDVCAFQYREMNQALLAARDVVDPERWVEVAYEDVLRDPVTTFSQAYEACGLTFSNTVRRHCETVLKRPYNAFSEIRLDKWCQGANRERIERVLPSVEAVARRMGYRNIGCP